METVTNTEISTLMGNDVAEAAIGEINNVYTGRFPKLMAFAESDEYQESVMGIENKSDAGVDTKITTQKSITLNPKYEKYLESLLPYINENQEIMNQMYSKVVRMTYNFIQMGNILTDAKKHLSKDDFTKLYEGLCIEERMVYRYIDLVKDDRVSALDMEELTSMLKPSMSKLMNMKKLSNTDFHKVLCGDDTPLIGNKKEDEEWIKKNIYPNSIDDKTYFNLLKMTKIEIMKYFLDMTDGIKNENNSLTNIVNLIKNSKAYQTVNEVA